MCYALSNLMLYHQVTTPVSISTVQIIARQHMSSTEGGRSTLFVKVWACFKEVAGSNHNTAYCVALRPYLCTYGPRQICYMCSMFESGKKRVLATVYRSK
jgi:uncharacterized Fe-S cluster-containing MiaB family protein